jgi:hypothetical protein
LSPIADIAFGVAPSGRTPIATSRFAHAPLTEFLQEFGQIAVLIRAALPQFARNVFRNVPCPSLGGVETDHPDRVSELALQQVGDDGFEIGVFDIGFAPGGPEPAKVIQHQICILIVARNN